MVIAPEDAAGALALGTRILLSSGKELFHLGADADRLYVIARGRLRLTMPMQVRGREEDVLVEERGPGDTVGWSALIPPYRFTLTATAPVETEVVAFSRETLRHHFDTYPEIGCKVALNLASVVGQRLQLFQTMWLREVERTFELALETARAQRWQIVALRSAVGKIANAHTALAKKDDVGFTQEISDAMDYVKFIANSYQTGKKAD